MAIVNKLNSASNHSIYCFNEMPPEVKFEIFTYLLPEMIKTLSLVCKNWKGFMGDDEMWRRIAKKIGLIAPAGPKSDNIQKAVLETIKKINAQLHFSSKSAKSMVCTTPDLVSGFPQTLRNIFEDCTDINGLSLVRVIRCSQGENSIVKMALRKGAKINPAEFTTALLQAIKAHDLELIKIVLKDKKTDISFTCIKVAFATGDMAIIQEIEKAIPHQSFSQLWENTTLSPDNIAKDRKGLFYAGAYSGDVEILKFAIKLGAIPGEHSFNFGVKSGKVKMVEFLLEKSLTADHYSFNLALKTGSRELVLFLNESLGLGPNDQSFEYVILSGSQEMVDWFKSTYPKFVICMAESMSRIIATGDPKALQLAINNFTFSTLSFEMIRKLISSPIQIASNNVRLAMQQVNKKADPALLRIALNDNKSTVFLDVYGLLPYAIIQLKNANIARTLMEEGYFSPAVEASVFIQLNDLDVFMLALEKKFIVRSSIQSAETLNAAISTGNLGLLRYLFEIRNRDWGSEIPFSQTSADALDIALQTGNVDIINFVADIIEAKPTQNSFDVAMKIAVKNRDPSLLKLAIEIGAKPGPKTQATVNELVKNPDFIFIQGVAQAPKPSH